MNIHKVLLISSLIVSSMSVNARELWNFNSGWNYNYEGINHKVTLPRAFNEDYAYKVLIDDLPIDTVLYSKTFRLPKSAKGKKVFIEFEGARQRAEVIINGHRIGMSENGVMAFGFDLTPFIKYSGDNNIEVLTNNDWDLKEKEHPEHSTFQWNNKNFNANYGGLPKNVTLHVTDDVYQTLPLYSSFGTTGVYVYAKDYDIKGKSATVCVESEVRNESGKKRKVALVVDITDLDGKTITSFRSSPVDMPSGTTAVLKASRLTNGLNFWSWGYGYLYDVKTCLEIDGKKTDDVVKTRTGFRKTDFRDGKIYLNDRVMMVHGYAQRTSNEWPGVGMSVPAWLSDYSNHEMVRSGGNLVRWMHVAPWKQDVESCDRVGLIQAMPAGDAEKDVEGRKWEQRVELMRDAIVYNRNNPSIIFYEGGNKGISESHMAELKALRDKFDPNGGRASGSREMLASKTSEYGGEMLYINKSGAQPLWAMEYCRDEGLRRYWDDWTIPYHKSGDGPLYRNADASVYNRNQDQLAIEHIRRWYDYWSVRPGMGDRVSSGGVKIIFSDTNTHCRGESNYRTSGVSDAMRIPKDSYYTHQVMWDGWVTPEKSRTYIMGHWNYEPGVVKPVYVVSDAPRVDLFLNGEKIGDEKVDYHFLHTFDSIPYVKGELKAISYDEEGNRLSEYAVKTAGDPSRILMSVTTAPEGMSADGADMALLQFEVVDADGIRCPTDNREISFSVEGPAEWRGGIAKGEGNRILSKVLPVENGVNRALLRSLDHAGTIRVTAMAKGLPPETIEWKTNPVVIKDGLSSYFQKDQLKGNLERGETPESPSYSNLKKTVKVIDVKAGCNQSTAENSIDDNEYSEWKNDGNLSTAWITYQFNEPSVVDEAELKLTGWRKRNYPIEIVADNGDVVWDGSTDTSLGYINLKLKPVKTSSLTIRLKGASNENEGFGQITELVEPVANELDLFKAKNGDKVNNELRIVEVDFLMCLAR